MKSIKPGRGPSMMGGIGSIFAGVFGVIWTLAAYSMGAPVFFCLFGVFFIVMAIVQAVYQFHNASGENRFSEFDITDEGEERDPFQERFGRQTGDSFYGGSPSSGSPPSGSLTAGSPPAGSPSSGSLTAGNPSSAGRRFCPYCGNPVEKDYEFCDHCGKRLPQ